MARHKLRDTSLAKLSKAGKPGVYSDGDGLYFRVQPSGSRSWVFIWRRHGARREIGLGAYGSGAGQVSLAAARTKAAEARAIVGSGGDPKALMAERQVAPVVVTFGKVCGEYIDAMQSKWRSAKTLDHWRRFEKVYSKPIANIPVNEVSTDDVLRMLRPIWQVKSETATKARARVKLVLDHAKARGLRQGENPAVWSGHINQILPPPKKLVRGHHPAMPYADVPNFMTVLRAAEGVRARALEFTILTAVRSALTRAATWDEFDLDKGLWKISADRTKTDKPLRVPLAERAVEIVSEMKKRSVNQYVFPAIRARTRHIPKGALTDALDDAGGGAYTPHGFRSAFRDWVTEETNFQESVAEAALAHASGDEVERAYRRGDALAKRRKLMDAWATFCSTVSSADNVVAIRRTGDNG